MNLPDEVRLNVHSSSYAGSRARSAAERAEAAARSITNPDQQAPALAEIASPG